MPDCLQDPVQCALDGRCPVCTIRKLQAQLRAAHRDISATRRRESAMAWALTQLSIRALDLGWLAGARFASTMLHVVDCDPELLRQLDGGATP